MSNFPNSKDDDSTLTRVDDNISEIGGQSINEIRSAIFNIEDEIGLGASGTAGSIAERLGISLEANGDIKPSAIASMGLVVLPITDTHISSTAGIQETKLDLAFTTTFLNSRLNNMSIDVRTSLDFITNHGFKIEPHIQGSGFKHLMQHILVSDLTTNYFKNKKGVYRNNAQSYSLFNDLNDDYIGHNLSNGEAISVVNGTVTGGELPPDNYAHVAKGIFLDTNNFSFIPQTAVDLQQLAQFLDNSNVFILGTRIKTLYANGISRTSRSSSLYDQERGQLIIKKTPATTYLLYSGATTPVDDIDNGDDVIEFLPPAGEISSHSFDANFNLIKIGDIITVQYAAFTVYHIIKEVKYTVDGSDKRYLVRIDGKNILAESVTAYVNRPLFYNNKHGVLAVAQAHHPMATLPSLIIGNARSAEVLGNGFNPNHFNSSHYNLYLQIYPTGNPLDSAITMAAIDVTGNQGATPGKYTLESIVEKLNNSFRTPGFNDRFIAFSYQGNIGIKMTDPINNVSFAVIDGLLSIDGLYNADTSSSSYPNNVIGVPGDDNLDALGFGPSGSGVSSPAFRSTFDSAEESLTPTKIHAPLTRKNFYINGVERERFEIEPHMSIDGYGESYWNAEITAKNSIPGTRVEVTYTVPFNLSNSRLQIGKTITVISENLIDSGRFFIKNVQFNNCGCEDESTDITVYDAIHYVGVTPSASAEIGQDVKLYFSTGDSVSFNLENLSDETTYSPFKRYIEVYMNQDGYSFTQERARMNISGSQFIINDVPLYSSTELSNINLVSVSSKLRGYLFGQINKINLKITSYNQTTGIFEGFLCRYDGSIISNEGPVTVGKKGQVVTFYDQTNVNSIDIIFNDDSSISTFTNKIIDIQLFPTLSLDDEVMLLATLQLNSSLLKIEYLRDKRQFGNVSEVQLTNSALDYISTPTKLLHENGIIRGFDTSLNDDVLTINGGTAIVNGKIIQIGLQDIVAPQTSESFAPDFNNSDDVTNLEYFVCLNDRAEIELIANTNYDLESNDASTYISKGLDHTRLFYVRKGSSNYVIRSSYLHDLITNNVNKNVVPLALINISYSESNVFYITSVSDLRRYVHNGFNGLNNPFSLGSTSSFRDISTLNNWLEQLNGRVSFDNSNGISKEILVKGDITIDNVIFNYPEMITFKGDGGKFIITSKATLTKNIKFEDGYFDISSNIGFDIGSSNIVFDNCIFDYKYNATSDVNFSATRPSNPEGGCIYGDNISFENKYNIQIKNSLFKSNQANRFAFISFTAIYQDLGSPGPLYLENILIENNRFVTTSTEDIRSVITFGPSANAPFDYYQGSRFVDCLISRNTCNTNQMIVVSGAPNDSSKMQDLPVPINFTIEKNICGSICYLTRDAGPYIPSEVSLIVDKTCGITIQENTCKYIFCGTIYGFINVQGSSNRVIYDVVEGEEIFSSSAILSKNKCFWMHVGLKNPSIAHSLTTNRPELIIENNKINSYPPASSLINYWAAPLASSYLNIGLNVDSFEGT